MVGCDHQLPSIFVHATTAAFLHGAGRVSITSSAYPALTLDSATAERKVRAPPEPPSGGAHLCYHPSVPAAPSPWASCPSSFPFSGCGGDFTFGGHRTMGRRRWPARLP